MEPFEINPKTTEDLQELYNSNLLKGFVKDLPVEVYHSKDCPGFSSSFIKNCAEYSYAHAVYKLEHSEKTQAMQIGSLLHEMVLENKFNFSIMPEGMRRDARSKDYQAFLLSNKDKIIITKTEEETIKGMYDSLLKHPQYTRLFCGAKKEYSAFWEDEETGLLLKARPDSFTKENIIVDIKTTSDARSFAFSQRCDSFGYHISAAMYLDGVSKLIGEKIEKFVLVAIENKPPHEIALYVFDEASIEKGRREMRQGLNKIFDALTGTGPVGYSQEFQDLSLPAYAFQELE